MGYWGWRPLVLGIFISTWVVGCNIATDNTATSASPSTYPHVTLTVGRLPTAKVSAAPTRAAPTRVTTQEASTPAPATPLALLVQPPSCSEMRPGYLLCLGRVDNPLAFPVEGVVVQVRLLQPDGTEFITGHSTIEQAAIPSGGFAPYQATFEAAPDDFSTTDARLLSAETADEDRIILLQIENLTGETVNGRLVVRATVYNPGTTDARIARALVTLLDSENQVLGYRVVSFDAGILLDAGSRLPLTIDLTPQALEVTPQYSLFVEAQPVDE